MNPKIDISNVTLQTERLILRPWRESDLEDFYAYASVDGVGEMAGWPHHENMDISRSILDSFIRHRKTFALEYQGRVVGSLGIEEYDEAAFPELENLRCRELGFVLAKDCWGIGLMTEAVRSVIEWLFTQKNLDAITCGHFAGNTRSASVQRKCGFRYHSTGIYQTAYGTEEPEIRNILHRPDWEQMK